MTTLRANGTVAKTSVREPPTWTSASLSGGSIPAQTLKGSAPNSCDLKSPSSMEMP